MRLLDKVVQGELTHRERDAGGTEHVMLGPAAWADRLRQCPTRFILDREAARQCSSLFRTEDCLPDPRDPLARPPARSFWLEYHTDGAGDPPLCFHNGPRMGVLAEFDDDERCGMLTCFGERGMDGPAEHLQYTLHFDFSDLQVPLPRGVPGLRIRQQDIGPVDQLLGRTRIVFSDEWKRWARRSLAGYDAEVGYHASVAWSAIPMMTCFNALLNSRSAFREAASDLERLNRARTKRRQPALLDHVEVRLDLAARPSPGTRVNGGGVRQTPRLHLVRGHSVHRHGKVFWRTSHFRGDSVHPLSRNVNVTASELRPRA